MMYIKENTNKSLFNYKDFLKTQAKVNINSEDQKVKLETSEGIFDMHPNMKDLQIGNTNIKEVEGLKNLRDIDTIMFYDNDFLPNFNGLNLKCKTFAIINSKKFTSIGNAKIIADHFNISNCPLFDCNFENIDTTHLDIDNSGKIKDLSFLKDTNITRLDLNNQNIESLYGIHFLPSIDLHLYGKNGNSSHDFMYHQLFYEKNKGTIKDYWKEIVDYWINTASSENKDGFTVLAEENELEDVLFNGIKLPPSEFKRLFTQEQLNIVNSLRSVNKFKL